MTSAKGTHSVRTESLFLTILNWLNYYYFIYLFFATERCLSIKSAENNIDPNRSYSPLSVFLFSLLTLPFFPNRKS